MKGWQQRLMACCVAIAVMVFSLSFTTVSAASQKQGTVIIDTESGETVEELMNEAVPAWASVDQTMTTDTETLGVGGKSALLMELSGGQVLYEKNPNEKLPIASVTKVMTLLLIMEAIDGGVITPEDSVTCSAHAASMGGSQIWLEEGEVMTVHELLKAISVVSANDGCAMMAEYISGSEESFVARMNERAVELGMNDTLFTDCCGLKDDAYSCAYDVALMSRELMKHKKITQYTTIWMDTLRDGKSQLVNTNKLVRFYPGANGLKTGTTSKAGHNLSATAERDGMELVSVILGCSTTAERFGGARKMLDYGFANYSVYTPKVDAETLTPVKVLRGVASKVEPQMDTLKPLLIKKGYEKKITQTLELPQDIQAPVYERQVIGRLVLMMEGNAVAEYDVYAARSVRRLGLVQAFAQIFKVLIT